jgi:uncharacterized protein YjbI with pentapeptide repeats
LTEADRRALARRTIDASPELAARNKQSALQKELLRDVQSWNKWRQEHPEVHPMLADRNLAGWPLEGCDFSYANLTQARLQGANLRRVNFHQAVLAKANLTGTDLTGANLCRADLYETVFCESRLIDANLQGAQLVGNDFAGAEVVNCTVYGLSAWDLKMDGAKKQGEFVIRYRPHEGAVEQTTTVEGLEMASFTYMALNNKNLTRLFNDAGRKWVLLLGRFTERKPFLEKLAATLKGPLIPIIFDFPRPDQRDVIESVLLLAGMSAFVIVDLTDARSTPLELQTIVPNYAVPIVPIIKKGEDPFSMFVALRKFDWVLPPLLYDSEDDLMKGLQKAVIEPATAKAQSLIDWKARTLLTRDIRDYL